MADTCPFCGAARRDSAYECGSYILPDLCDMVRQSDYCRKTVERRDEREPLEVALAERDAARAEVAALKAEAETFELQVDQLSEQFQALLGDYEALRAASVPREVALKAAMESWANGRLRFCGGGHNPAKFPTSLDRIFEFGTTEANAIEFKESWEAAAACLARAEAEHAEKEPRP